MLRAATRDALAEGGSMQAHMLIWCLHRSSERAPFPSVSDKFVEVVATVAGELAAIKSEYAMHAPKLVAEVWRGCCPHHVVCLKDVVGYVKRQPDSADRAGLTPEVVECIIQAVGS